MFQRPANMKPAAMDGRIKVDLYELINFFNDANARFSKDNEDVAFVFEMMSEYFSKDYKPGSKLKFTGGAVGL